MDKYEQMKAQGATANVIAIVLKTDGKSSIESMKVLRTIFDLPLMEVKEIVVRRDTGLSLYDYQGQLFEQWLKELEAEDELLT